MQQERFIYLFSRLTNVTLGHSERLELMEMWLDPVYEPLCKELLDNWYDSHPVQDLQGTAEAENLFTDIISYNRAPYKAPARRVHFLRSAWLRYAAAIILLITGIALFFQFHNHSDKETAQQALPLKPDILPGKNMAVLTLSDGRKVEIGKASSETIKDGNLAIENNRGQLVYKNSHASVSNTMSTPNGGQYKLVLSDGTIAWLNAASSITYPTAFVNKTREVSITGEVYFEVAKNAGKPFVVHTRKESIDVLGTSFNVNSYPDESASKISLAEGSVRVNHLVLKPGQAYENGKIIETNIEQDIAWKNGIFNFQDKKFDEVMRQIARWYDVEIIYSKEIPDDEYIGKLKRNLTLLQILEILEKNSDIHFQLDGHKLIIKP